MKGQGGNKFINVELFVGSRDNSVRIAEITLNKTDEGYRLYASTLTLGDDNQCIDVEIPEEKGNRAHPFIRNCDCAVCLPRRMMEAKGKQQKGENKYTPRLCRSGMHDNNKYSCVC
jgi:hypothetical protein